MTTEQVNKMLNTNKTIYSRHALANMAKVEAYKRGYMIIEYPKKAELIKIDGMETVDECFNNNFHNPVFYDSNMVFELYEPISKEEEL